MNNSVYQDHGGVEDKNPDETPIGKENILLSPDKIVQQTKNTGHDQQVRQDALTRRNQEQTTE
ncbi:hypothetical protein KAM346_37840 [Aeromonas caviae]|nr:hypothetical protein KAM346_37840 [Aeromonas caviae]